VFKPRKVKVNLAIHVVNEFFLSFQKLQKLMTKLDEMCMIIVTKCVYYLNLKGVEMQVFMKNLPDTIVGYAK